MLWLIFLAVTFVFGLSIAKEFFDEEKIFAAFPIGAVFATWVVFLLSMVFGFSITTIVIATLLLMLAIYKIGVGGKIRLSRWALAIALIALAFFTTINYLFIFNRDAKGNLLSSVISDLPYHASIISTFAYDDNFPPVYPYFPSKKLTYHFLFDFFSGILGKLGLGLGLAIQLPNILVEVSVVMLVYFLALRITKDKVASAISVLLTFLNGSFGFIEFFKAFLNVPDEQKVKFLTDMGAYSVWLPDKGYVITNIIGEFTLNQRVFAIGVCIFIIVSLLLISNKKKTRNYLLSGVLTGLLPLFHIYSFLAALVFSFVYFIFYKDRNFALFFILVILLSVPQLFYLQEKNLQTTIRFEPGWAGRADPPYWSYINQGLLEFWGKNFGLYILLSVLGAFLLKKDGKVFALFGLSLFVMMNLFMFQVSKQNNIKFMFFVFIAASIISSLFLTKVIKKGRFGAAISILLISIMVIGGIQTIMAWVENYDNILYYKNEVAACEFIRVNTAEDAIFASNSFRDCINSLGGRKVFLRLDSMALLDLGAHNINYENEEKQLRDMLMGDCGLMKKNGISYLFLDSRNPNPVNLSFIESNFDSVYREGEFSIYKVRC